MSTAPDSSSASPAIFQDQQRVPPGEIFDEFLFYNDEFCSCCFNRIRRVDHTKLDDTDKMATEGDVLETRKRAGTGVSGFDYETHDSYGVRTVRDEDGKVTGVESKGSYGIWRTYSTTTFCDNCGSNNGYMPQHSTSKRTMVRRADQLVDTLLEMGIPIQRQACKHFVASAKERPNIDGKDHDIYANAVKIARRAFVDAVDDSDSES